MSAVERDTPQTLARRIDDALRARARLATRPLGVTIDALAAAARRWCTDESLAAALPGVARLSPAMVAAVLPMVAATLDPAAMTALVERDCPGAAARPARPGPTLVGHVLASNVPALALPAVALGCLGGAAVVVKSGRDDTLSATVFQRALAAVDPDLAATIVDTYWPGGERAREDEAFRRADVVVATGGDAALAALAPRLGKRLLAHGPRASVVLAGDPSDEQIVALARDVVLYDQRGCLSPLAVYVTGDAVRLAEALAAALGRARSALPPGPATIAERAAGRVFRDQAEWAGASALGSTDGMVLRYPDARPFRPGSGRRTIEVYPLAASDALPALLPDGAIECVGVAGADAAPLVPALAARGVARVCPVGRMQQPPLSWPRGQRPPLAPLARPAVPLIEVET